MAFENVPALPDFLEAEMPFQRFAYRLEEGSNRGYLMHGIDDGPRDAPVVWMQHGNPTWSFLWRKVIKALPEDRFRVVAPDLLGLGLSDKWPSTKDHSLARHIDSLVELAKALEISSLIAVGQDWGGPTVAGLCTKGPASVNGVVLGNTSVLAPKRPRGTAFHRFSQLPIVSDLFFKGLGIPQTVMHRVQGDRSSIQGLVKKAYTWPLRKFKDRSAPLAMARMVPNAPDHPSLPSLQEGEAWMRSFEGPMALVWGEQDPILGRILKRHAEAFPEATVTKTQAGHFLQEEVFDEIAAAIVDVADRAGA